MPKFPSIPRLSIVVPVGENAAAFEATLVSVLQNRPDSCEVIVAHDGRYDDPFDLAEEVRFAVAGSSRLLALLDAAAEVARGRFIHVLADGHTASEGWTDAALNCFERNDAGSVAAVVCDSASGLIDSAGWCRSASSAFELIGCGRVEVSSGATMTVDGPLLNASFWRRDLLRCVASTYRGTDVLEASMVTSLTAAKAGWRCVVARDCLVTAPDSSTSCRHLVGANHRRLQAIADAFGTGGWGKSFSRGLQTVLAGRFMPSAWASAVQRATSPLAASSVAKCIRHADVRGINEELKAIALPARAATAIRNAA